MKLPTLQELSKNKNYEIRHNSTPLKNTEQFDKVITPFDFSNQHGGTINSVHYYNNFYLYPTN